MIWETLEISNVFFFFAVFLSDMIIKKSFEMLLIFNIVFSLCKRQREC